jgi:hypothetical protein
VRAVPPRKCRSARKIAYQRAFASIFSRPDDAQMPFFSAFAQSSGAKHVFRNSTLRFPQRVAAAARRTRKYLYLHRFGCAAHAQRAKTTLLPASHGVMSAEIAAGDFSQIN